MERVTGVGGVFFRTADPEGLTQWYADTLGVDPTGPTVWAAFPEDTDYFGPSGQRHMVNYRVADLDAMLAQLRAAGATVSEEVQDSEYGRFGWATDPAGNRFELWQAP